MEGMRLPFTVEPGLRGFYANRYANPGTQRRTQTLAR